MSDQNKLILKQVLEAWNGQLVRTSKLFDQLTDAQIESEVSPGRNTGTYLLGHLTAVHDALFPLLGIGDKLFPQLEDAFMKNPDKSTLDKPSVKQLRLYWNDVHAALANHFSNFTVEQWLQKHTAVSDEDFVKEPHRNRLNVLLSRTNHLAYHFGQLMFLKK